MGSSGVEGNDEIKSLWVLNAEDGVKLPFELLAKGTISFAHLVD